jgi:glycosyltransferase involved in cell wall biosynthesis
MKRCVYRVLNRSGTLHPRENAPKQAIAPHQNHRRDHRNAVACVLRFALGRPGPHSAFLYPAIAGRIHHMPSSHSENRPSSRSRPVIVHAVERMAPGGIETLVLDMAHGLPGEHIIFSLAGTEARLRSAWPRLAAFDGRLEAFGRRPRIEPPLIGRIWQRLRSLAPDAVIVHHDGPLLYAGLAARCARVPILIHVDHDAWHYENARRRRLVAFALALARPRQVAVSSEIARAVQRYFGSANITVIPPGIDTAAYRPGAKGPARALIGVTDRVPLIGTSGRLVAVKNQTTLIDALSLLRARMPVGPELVILGEGPERSAIELHAAALGLTGFVHLPGHRDDLASVLPAFDVYALPSLSEGLPRGVLEAQAAGLAVVASDVGAMREAVCPDTGRLVPPRDPLALADALERLLVSPADETRPRAFVESRFALSRTLAQFADLITPREVLVQ